MSNAGAIDWATSRLTVACAVAVALLIGCAPPQANAQAAASRDSAGIRIVENPPLLNAPVRFRLAPQPTFDVGGLEDDPDLEFNSRRGTLTAIPLLGGGLAVLDVVRVQIFSRTGERERVTGREGAGPREFRELYSGCGLRGDTLVVFDGQLARAVTLSPRGEFVQTTQRDEFRSTLPRACFDDGTILVKRTLARRSVIGSCGAPCLLW